MKRFKFFPMVMVLLWTTQSTLANAVTSSIFSVPAFTQQEQNGTEYSILNATCYVPGTSYSFSYEAYGTNVPVIVDSVLVAGESKTFTYSFDGLPSGELTIVALADRYPEAYSITGFDSKHQGVVGANHLYETVGNEATDGSSGAIINASTHSVVWNGEIDLNPFIETHYSYTCSSDDSQSFQDQVMSQAMMDNLGLHYEFNLVDYCYGRVYGDDVYYQTSESKYMTELSEGVFSPRTIDAEGNTTDSQSRTTVDREPLVRVNLVTRSGDIICYGYIKLHIVNMPITDMQVTVTFSDTYMDAGAKLRTSWAQMENLILSRIGEYGMTKSEFERDFYLDVENGSETLPSVVEKNYTKRDGTDATAPAGGLYQDAATNKWWAKRFYQKGEAEFLPAVGVETEEKAFENIQDFTNTNNWFGRVWYTPHDGAQGWDEMNDVLVWKLCEGDMGNLNGTYFKQLIKVVNPIFDNNGLNTQELSTIIRFVSRSTGQVIYVKLVIPVDKLHFEYGVINNKDWSHWYQMNSAIAGIPGSSPYWSEFDIHANAKKPSNVDYLYLNASDLTQRLDDAWMNPKEMLSLRGEKVNFTVFSGASGEDLTTSFLFTYPTKDLNSIGTSAGITTLAAYDDGTTSFPAQKNVMVWNVEGASGTIWSLSLAEENTAIVAIGRNGKSYLPGGMPERVAYLDGSSDYCNNVNIHYCSTAAATDLLNKSGAYNAQGKARFTNSDTGLTSARYLEKNIDEAFTVYLKVVVSHPYYDPIIGNQYFNVRYLRPINVAGVDVTIDDYLNEPSIFDIKDMISIVDWNRTPVVAAGSNSIKPAKNVFGIEFPSYSDVYEDAEHMKQQNLGIPFEYYGITELAIRYDELRTDMVKPISQRVYRYHKTEDILNNTVLLKDTPMMTSMVNLLNADNSIVSTTEPHAYNHSDLNATGNGTQFGKLSYMNNSSMVGNYHIYVPIVVKYNWGNIAYDDRQNSDIAFTSDCTQQVWAVIIINSSHDSGRWDIDAPEYDVNGDETLDTQDVEILVEKILTPTVPDDGTSSDDPQTPVVVDIPDVDGDGVTTVKDLVMLINRLSKTQ